MYNSLFAISIAVAAAAAAAGFSAAAPSTAVVVAGALAVVAAVIAALVVGRVRVAHVCNHRKRGGKDSRGGKLEPKCLQKRGCTHTHTPRTQAKARDTLGAASIPRTNAHKAGLGARLCLEAGLGDHSERERERERERDHEGGSDRHPTRQASDTRTYAHKGTTAN